MGVKGILVAGALLAGLGVALGAFGAHGLDAQLQKLGRTANLEQRTAWFETGVRYHMYHALALLAVAAIASRSPSGGHQLAAAAFLLGILLFSGSLYVMTFADDDWKKLGAVTPLGGLAFLIGWATLAITAWRELSGHGGGAQRNRGAARVSDSPAGVGARGVDAGAGMQGRKSCSKSSARTRLSNSSDVLRRFATSSPFWASTLTPLAGTRAPWPTACGQRAGGA
jgi:uncharacterized membrane protein YgdD (TMEM256/DUF423 family)